MSAGSEKNQYQEEVLSTVLFRDISIIYGTYPAGIEFLRGWEANSLPSLVNHSILTEDGIITAFIPEKEIVVHQDWEVVSLKNKTVIPGFTECHTHAVFAGDRSDEFLMKLRGATYEEIAERGGGIVSTMKKVRDASEEDLLALLLPRIQTFIEQGVTTLEIKSGYGLNTQDELKMLRTIKRASKLVPVDIIPTFLGAHTLPPEHREDRNKYIDKICNEMLPSVADEQLARFCDGFLEKSTFQPDEIERIFETAAKYDLSLRLHTDQFHSIGGLELGLKMNCRSVDHLEVISQEQTKLFKDSPTAAVLLPGVSYFLNYNYAPARDLIDSDAIIALATDYNPGSSHIDNIFLIMSLAAVKMKLSINEIMNSYSINSAYVCGVSSRTGSLTTGKQADFAVIENENLNQIVYNTGKNPVVITVKKGEIIYQQN